MKHYHSIARNVTNSYHELRRLQITACWLGGREEYAVEVSQPNVLEAAASEAHATRVISITPVPKYWDVETGEAKLVSGLEQLVIKGSLVRTRHEESQNQLVAEFTSIRDAWNAQKAINNGDVLAFRGLSAKFAMDPIDKAPVARADCECRPCKKGRS